MFTYIFDGLNERYRNEIEAVRAQHPFKDLRYARPSLRLTFQEGIQLLQEAGYDGKLVFVFQHWESNENSQQMGVVTRSEPAGGFEH
jgi:hypothetical protein